ncbi:MAG: ORF6N domain-containing protein [Fibrobacter sp.]|nr:ORF6N domain-containing protein [Fibrobacter sp.]
MTQELVKIKDCILFIRGKQVMLDRDLARYYGTETKRIKEQVNRNKERFPEEFCFKLSPEEFENWRSQFATSNADKMGLRHAPYVFTEQGVAMLSAVLKSKTAVQVSIQIMNAFVEMRHYIANNAGVINRISNIETRMITYDKNFETLFKAMENNTENPKEGVFFQGQIFDAYLFVQKIIKQAKQSLVIIDNYVDLSILEMLSKKKNNVSVKLYTLPKTKLSPLDIAKFNGQYPSLELYFTDKIHDRFVIIDSTMLYHFGASLKDLGKKCFAFDLMNDPQAFIPAIMNNLQGASKCP